MRLEERQGATPCRASSALFNFEFHPESNGKLLQASEANEWNEPCFVFKLTQAVMCVKQTDPPQSAGALTRWLSK